MSKREEARFASWREGRAIRAASLHDVSVCSRPEIRALTLLFYGTIFQKRNDRCLLSLFGSSVSF